MDLKWTEVVRSYIDQWSRADDEQEGADEQEDIDDVLEENETVVVHDRLVPRRRRNQRRHAVRIAIIVLSIVLLVWILIRLPTSVSCAVLGALGGATLVSMFLSRDWLMATMRDTILFDRQRRREHCDGSVDGACSASDSTSIDGARPATRRRRLHTQQVDDIDPYRSQGVSLTQASATETPEIDPARLEVDPQTILATHRAIEERNQRMLSRFQSVPEGVNDRTDVALIPRFP
jgi:hypothetical protein